MKELGFVIRDPTEPSIFFAGITTYGNNHWHSVLPNTAVGGL
jgi:hypothetical protein